MSHLGYVLGAYLVFVVVLGADVVGSWWRLRQARAAVRSKAQGVQRRHAVHAQDATEELHR